MYITKMRQHLRSICAWSLFTACHFPLNVSELQIKFPKLFKRGTTGFLVLRATTTVLILSLSYTFYIATLKKKLHTSLSNFLTSVRFLVPGSISTGLSSSSSLSSILPLGPASPWILKVPVIQKYMFIKIPLHCYILVLYFVCIQILPIKDPKGKSSLAKKFSPELPFSR